jgi:hypothetical protein
VATRPQRDRSGAGAGSAGAKEAALQRRIDDAEAERVRLERRVSEAFTRGDHREGTQAAKQLERHRARLDDLYEQWLAAQES